MKKNEVLERLIRIEDKIDSHLLDHKKKFDLFTRVLIPSTSILVSAFTATFTHFWTKR